MATQTESTVHLNKSRGNSYGHQTEKQPQIRSTALVTGPSVVPLTLDQRHELIAVAAYHLAEARNMFPMLRCDARFGAVRTAC
jgi:hypothetical protein